jgi:hypothetical protein
VTFHHVISCQLHEYSPTILGSDSSRRKIGKLPTLIGRKLIQPIATCAHFYRCGSGFISNQQAECHCCSFPQPYLHDPSQLEPIFNQRPCGSNGEWNGDGRGAARLRLRHIGPIPRVRLGGIEPATVQFSVTKGLV